MHARLLASCVGLAAAVPALAQPQTYLMVANGPVFTPDPTAARAVMLFNAQDGSVVNTDFVPRLRAEYDMDFPRDVIQVGSEIWVTDQVAHVIYRFDLLGSYVGGINGDMANIRGMHVHEGVVYIANGAAAGASPALSVVRRDTSGAYLGAFSAGPQPFDTLVHNGELLVVNSTTSAAGGPDVTRWGLDGTPLGDFHFGSVVNALHIHRKASNGNFLLAGSGTPTGLYEIDGTGTQVGFIALTSPRASFELGNGNILYTRSNGVHIYDLATQVSTLVTSRQGHFLNLLTFDPSLSGACCLPDGTCQVLAMSACGAQSGIYRGPATACATANCPQPGACCLPGGTCVVSQPEACRVQNGVWYGPGTACSAGTCLSVLRSQAPTASFVAFDGSGVFLNLTAAAASSLVVGRIDYFPVSGNSSPVTVDIYTRPGTYVGFTGSPDGWTLTQTLNTTAIGGVTLPTRLTLASPIEVPAGGTVGVYVVGVAGGVRYRSGASTITFSNADLTVFTDTVTQSPAFFGPPTAARSFTGAVFYSIGAACYANCDESTQAPVLNVADFGCFLTRYAAGEAYANCDESTQAPVLNVADFGCFLTKYAAGCP